MAVFRVERTGDYTVMSNFHLKDKRLSLKAKGLLSQMLLQSRTYRFLYADNSARQAVFCRTARQYPDGDMINHYFLRRLVVPP